MKIKKFLKPQLVGNIGNMHFVLYDENKTKSFYAAGQFDNRLGVYPILNNKNEIVEYMDLVGNFTLKPTKFAKHFNSYIMGRWRGVCYGSPTCFTYYTSLLDFPSKYLISAKIKEIVKIEERDKYKEACKEGQLRSLIEKLYYRFYIEEMIYQKISKSKMLLKKLKSNSEYDEELYINI